MSNSVNTNLIEYAKELAEECTNSAMGSQLDYAIRHSNMEYLYELTKKAEKYLMRMEAGQ